MRRWITALIVLGMAGAGVAAAAPAGAVPGTGGNVFGNIPDDIVSAC